ncbi:hypothetical protein [Mesorhizobium sp. CA7]|uniref:hypothetical protein n=1 Tax=Mesorhizobium sp. CA7 TaxID=588501 RepID=UPI001CCCE96C|nr:hypothetical protein [Mesorhizobium sp. CA7]MBZ9815146.1 hypothetical protein [Mesorhizobium sp. CA7]
MTACVYTGAKQELAADAVVLVTSRNQDDAVWRALKARENEWAGNGIRSIKVIGDAEAPGPIAWATYAGHALPVNWTRPISVTRCHFDAK